MKTNEVTKQPKEIKAEISFEIIGEDEPTKYDKRRKRWACASRWALLALVVSILSCLPFGLNIYSLVATAISTLVLWIAIDGASTTHPDEPGYYNVPWKLGFSRFPLFPTLSQNVLNQPLFAHPHILSNSNKERHI